MGMSLENKYLGQVFRNDKNKEFKIIEYLSSANVMVKFTQSQNTKWSCLSSVRKGRVNDRHDPRTRRPASHNDKMLRIENEKLKEENKLLANNMLGKNNDFKREYEDGLVIIAYLELKIRNLNKE